MSQDNDLHILPEKGNPYTNDRGVAMPAGEQIAPEEIRIQLHEILESKDFQASPRLRDFLNFVVERTITGHGQDLKAYTVALEVFGLGTDFDPNTNPLIRTEAGRLRSKLEHFYLHNPNARISISIPKGGYAAAFSRISASTQEDPAKSVYSFAPLKVAQPEYKASIMLMPFSVVNKDSGAEPIVDGLTNAISIHLTRFRDLKIINYNQVTQLEPVFKDIMAKEMNLNARFILCGSVQLEKNIVEVYASLIDSTSMYIVWAEKFDAELEPGSQLEMQESIAQFIVSRIADDFGLLHRTLLQEMASGTVTTSSIQEASLLYYHWTTVLTREDFARALESVEKAHQSDETHIPTLSMLADLYASNQQWTYGLVDNALEKSLQLANEAVNQDPGCQLAYVALALNYHLRTDRDKFQYCAERALELNPSSTNALSALASWYALSGLWDKSFELTEKIIDLSTSIPGWCHFVWAMYRYVNNDYERSLAEAQKINMPNSLWDPLIRLALCGFLENPAEREEAVARLTSIYPDFLKTGKTIVENSLPYPEMSGKVLEGMARAGVKF